MSVRAWLLSPADAPRLAIAEHALIEVIAEPTTYPVVATRHGRDTVFRWRDQLLAVTDPGRLSATAEPSPPPEFVVIGAWQDEAGTPLRHGAIAMHEPPRAINVEDDMEIPLPEDMEQMWVALANACFDPDGQGPVIAIDLKRLLSGD